MQDENRLRVGVLGATGAVGVRFVSLLTHHPWFQVTRLMASEKSAGKPYRDAVGGLLPLEADHHLARMTVQECKPVDDLDLVFSGLPAKEAQMIEEEFAGAGIPVVSNSSSHRMVEDVPLMIPEVNPDHAMLIPVQKTRRNSTGFIVTNPNCSTIALTLGLDAIHRRFGISKIIVTTAQAISGAGFPGLSAMTMLDNVIPFIRDEESKLETEPAKIFGSAHGRRIHHADMIVSAGCTRVAVRDGHLMHVSFSLVQAAADDDAILQCWKNYRPPVQDLNLPSSPENPVEYLDLPDRPQPLLDRDRGNGMTVTIGRLRPCPVLDWKCVMLSHNTIRGAAGGAILLAELLVAKGCIGNRYSYNCPL